MQITARRMYYTTNGINDPNNANYYENVTTATSGTPSAWLYAVANVNFTTNSSKSGWLVTGDVQIKAQYEVYISASNYYYATIYIYEGNTLIGSTTASIKEKMWSTGGGATTATVNFQNKEIIPNKRSTSNLYVKLVVDFTDFTAAGVATSGQSGIGYTSFSNGVIKRTESDLISASVSELPPLLAPPSIANLTNTNKYNSKNEVSASTNSISIKWDKTGDEITESWYKVDNNDWVKLPSPVLQYTIPDLNPGTTYKIIVQCGNAAGYGNVLETTIRTRYTEPVVALELEDTDLESLLFEWTSDKDIAYPEYKINNGEWTPSQTNGTSGAFIVDRLQPNTTYTIYFRGVSIEEYDGLISNVVSVEATTYDIGRIQTISNCIFGNSITIDIKSDSYRYHMLEIWTSGNSRKPIFTFDRLLGGPQTFTFSPTQEQLDDMYKCYTNKNEIPIFFLLTTYGDDNDWKDNEYQRSLQLTGIAKTAHVGINDKPRRAQVWMGVNNQPKRAVSWVGVNDTPRRCI